MLARQMLKTAWILASFAVIGTAMVAITHEGTEAQIQENQRQAVLRQLHALIPPSLHDNDLHQDRIRVTAPDALGATKPLPVYRARKDGEPIGTVLTVVAPDGYNGAIRLLVAVHYDGTILGTRVTQHQETPGLGDGIEHAKSDWITQFNGKSLGSPPEQEWRVEKDGGVFDQLTGATITPRAVVKAVRKALEYFQTHRAEIFSRQREGVTDESTAI